VSIKLHPKKRCYTTTTLTNLKLFIDAEILLVLLSIIKITLKYKMAGRFIIPPYIVPSLNFMFQGNILNYGEMNPIIFNNSSK
jgi:hypothetical protein